jgi:uncharacterized membrane protein YkoI
MKARLLLTLVVLALAKRSDAQTKYRIAGGEVSRSSERVDVTRLSTRIPGMDASHREHVHVSGDSAQRIAMGDFDWRGSVSSIEFDDQDARVFWDVKIVPDSSLQTIIRYRIDATNGGILDIKEFSGIRGLARRKP